MASIFQRLAKTRPAPPVEEKTKPDHAQRMLDWLINKWTRESVSVSDLMTFGPRPRQNAEEALKLASILERQGWLTPKNTPRKDMQHWNIVRRPVVHPKLTTAE
jgi:hypothetical protein